jgi:hypothetical protein
LETIELRNQQSPVDCIYIPTSTRDARFTRICVASIRRFYPETPIRLLVGECHQRWLERELRQYWGVETVDLPGGDYGWGFVKLEALFGPPVCPLGERFLMLDPDTVLTGPVLDVWRGSHAPFLVDDEEQSEANMRHLSYDWDQLRKIDPNTRRPEFVFNSGQWFGTAGVLKRDDFTPWVEWTKPRRLRYPQYFFPGEMGVLVYVLNHKVMLEGLAVERRRIMRYPPFGMDGLDAGAISRGTAPSLVIHWSGVKKWRQRDMIGSDVLTYFEKLYFQQLPAGRARRLLAICGHFWTQWMLRAQVMVKLAFRRLYAHLSGKNLTAGTEAS